MNLLPGALERRRRGLALPRAQDVDVPLSTAVLSAPELEHGRGGERRAARHPA